MIPLDDGMKYRPCRFSDRVLLTVSMELVLLVLLDRLPRVVAAMISSGDGII